MANAMRLTFSRHRFATLIPACLAVCLLGGCRSRIEPAGAAAGVTGTSGGPGGAPGAGIFRDTAETAGLHFHWGHNGRSPLTIRDTAGGGCAFLDFDGDGLLDILLVGERVALYRNRGDGTFEDVSAESGLAVTGPLMGCAVGDFDNDGWPDILITGYGVTKLYRNVRGQRPFFRDVTDAAHIGAAGGHADWTTSAGFADLDGDGFLDLVICRYVTFTADAPQLCDMEAPDGTPVQAACPPFYYDPQRLLVYRNRGNGTFEDVSDRLPDRHGASLGVGFADYDDDGRMDFYVANDGEPGDLYHNRGGWKFENTGLASGTAYNQDGHEQAGMGVDWGDYDGDGRLDLAVATFQDEPRSLYRNEGNGLFSYASYSAGIGDISRHSLAFGAAFLDFDNDGHADLLFANGHVQDNIAAINHTAAYKQPMQLFSNRGDGTFADANIPAGPAFQRPIVGRALAVGDYDNDGKMDVLVADLEGAPILLHNESRNAGHWLGVRALLATGREALGARVTLETEGGRTYVAEMQTCRSYLSASDPRVHFGLGTADCRVKHLTVRWPDGKKTTVSAPAIDRYLTVREEAR